MKTAQAVQSLHECQSVKWINALVQEGRQITATDIADNFAISCGSGYSIIHEELGYHKICARWVTKQLTYEHKQVCSVSAASLQQKTSFMYGIRKFTVQTNKCVVRLRDYVKKWQYICPSTPFVEYRK